VYWFGATSAANDLASEMIYPLLPAFVTRTLGGGALALGILDGVADAIAAGFKLVSGYLADRPRLREPMVVAGYGVAAVVRPLIAAALAAWHVIALRAVDRLGKGVRTAPRDVMIADVVPDGLRGRAFGVHRGADHVGAIVGPLLAAALIGAGFTVRHVFWLAVIPGLAAVVLSWVAVRRASGIGGQVPRVRGQVPGAEDPPASGGTRPPIPDISRQGLGALVAVLAVAALLRAPETLLILRAQDLGVAVAAVPILWAALHVVRSSASYPGGVLADRWGPRRTLAVGWLCYALLAFAFAHTLRVHLGWIVFLAFGLATALTESPERKLVAALAGGPRRGRGFGWYHAAQSAVALPGAALFGWLYQAVGANVALTASAATTLAAVILLGLVGSRGER
jgi:MFS family permease